MVSRHSDIGEKEPTIHCLTPGYGPEQRIPSTTSNREVPAFHASGTGGGPGMRGTHQAPPTQPPTPPTSQDIKQPSTHLQPQAHQMPPQSGGQIMQFPMPSAGRGNSQQQFYSTPRAPLGSQRLAPHVRPPVVMSNNAPSFMSQSVVQPVFQGVISTPMSGQGQMFVSPPMNQPFPIQQPRHQSGTFYSTQPIMLQQHAMFTPYSQPLYYPPSIPSMSRAGGPASISQGGGPIQPQPSLTLIAGHGGTMISTPGVSHPVQQGRLKKKLQVIDPKNGRNVLEDINDNGNTSSGSGESSTRQTPQPPVTVINPDTGRDVINDFINENPSTKFQGCSERMFPPFDAGQKTDAGLAADFATRVAIAARADHSGSPNSPALQQSSSRTSNYSESESQASPDPQGMSTPSVSPSKLDTSVESISSEGQIVENNNLTYDSNQQASMLRGSWTPVLGAGMPVDILPMSLPPGMMIPDDMIRAAPLPNQSAREYQAVQPPWITEGNPLPVIISKDPGTQMETSARPGPERVTPVVSALTEGPTVDIGPRPQREQFPALGKSHQQLSPAKRKQRSEQTQESGDGKGKESQSKSKTITPSIDNKKHIPQSSQDSDEFVQSVQTKNNEPKTITIKKNDSDNSGTKTKPNDNVKNKESNNIETRNLNEDVVEDNNNRNKSENEKCEMPTPKESSPALVVEEPSEKVVEEVRENASPLVVSEAEVFSVPVEDAVSLKTNGESAEEDDWEVVPTQGKTSQNAKSNNQKSKPGNKRLAQSKMRLETKDSRNAEPETPAIEVTPSATPVPDTKNSEPSTVVTNEQSEKVREEPAANEDKEKEKEDLIVATKNEENTKQTTSIKANDATTTPAVPNKVVLKHTYEVDQWSPLNPEGKKKYDRQFIMGLQNEPHSRRKPANLPNLDLLSDSNKQRHFDRNAINSMNRSHVDSLIPPFANRNSSQRGGAITKRGSQQGKPKAAKPNVVQVSLQQDVKLHETENAWKPTRITEPTNRTEEEAKTEALYKRVRGILNKLTPEKFDRLVAQVRMLPIDNPERLEGVIDLVFKKAVDEPSFSVAYAQMCSTLQRMEVPSDTIRPDGKPEPENFRKLLLGRCQQEFEKNTAAELKRDERLKEIDQEKDPEKKKMLQLAFEEEERKIRMRSVGNIRFIGELYKLQMLTCGIMHSCINHLLGQGDEESLECLCKLLTTIGEGLESKESANKTSSEKGQSLKIYFNKLKDIVSNKGSGKISSRVRFMIQDLIDLRNNKWIPRRVESQPKPIDQIQKEAERENFEMNLALNSPQEKNKRQDIRNSNDNRKRAGAPDSAGWTTIPQNKSKYVIESSKLKLDQSDVEVASTVSLGNRTQFIWGPGASSGKSDDKRFMSQLNTNKFAVLSSTGSGNSSLKGSSYGEKDRMNSYKAMDDDVRSSKSGSQQDSRSSSRESASSKREEGRSLSSTFKPQIPFAPPAASKQAPPMSMEEKQKIFSRILNDYISCSDLNEAQKDIEEFLSPNCMKDFVVSLCNEIMEKRGPHSKRSIGVLFNHLITKKKISKEQFLVGLSEVLETADDLAIDMPLVWDYFAEILVDMFVKEVITFKDLASAVDPIRGLPGSEKFLAALVKILIEVKDENWLQTGWKKSKVKLSDFIDEKEVNNFAKKNNVGFMSEKPIKSELKRLITAKASLDEIKAWVSENVGDKTNEPSFIRTLMTVLLEASVTKNQSSSYKLDTEFLSHYEPLIHIYTGHAERLELPCLFAVQAFVHKLEYPQSIVHSIFHHLWDDNWISLETFKKWRISNDPHEQEGHAVCVTSLTSFFTHLDETETDEES